MMVSMVIIFIVGCAPVAPTNPADSELLNFVQGKWTGEIVLRGTTSVTVEFAFSGQEVTITSSNAAEGHARSNNPMAKGGDYSGYTKTFSVDNGKIVFYLRDGARVEFKRTGPNTMETAYRGDVLRVSKTA